MKTKSTTVLIVFSLIAIASVAAYYFSYEYIIGLEDKTLKSTTDLSYFKAKYNRAISLKVVASTGEDKIGALEKYLVHPGEEIAVVKNLEQLASTLSLVASTEVIDSQEDAVLAGHKGELLHIVMTVSGGKLQVRQFLTLVESLPYNVKLNSIDISQRGDGAEGVAEWQGRLDFSLVEEKGVVN